MGSGEPVVWHSISCPRPTEMAALQAAYERAAKPNLPRPGVIVLLSESGLGKTRLLQEFFHWLSTTKDGVGEAGYWQDRLAREGDNLHIDPNPALCNSRVPLPFLWWGVRLADPGRSNQGISQSVLASCVEGFDPHVEPMLRARRRAERGKEVRRATGDLLVEGILEGLGHLVPGVSPVKAGIVFTRRIRELWAEQRADHKAVPTPGEIGRRARQNLSDRYFECLRALLDVRQGFDRAVPFVFVIKDAQWAGEDPALLDLVDRVLQAANEKHWPLLLIISHWEAEWNAGSSMREIVERHTPDNWRPIKLGPHPDLSSCVVAGFSGLTPQQTQVLLDKAGGNPRLLDEIPRWLSEHPRLFAGRDLDQPMTAEGQASVEDATFDLHRLVERRLNQAPPEIKATLAVSGLQGMRFLVNLTEEVFRALHDTCAARCLVPAFGGAD
jgi:hypothetical protein